MLVAWGGVSAITRLRLVLPVLVALVAASLVAASLVAASVAVAGQN
jgi:hypothetical protein